MDVIYATHSRWRMWRVHVISVLVRTVILHVMLTLVRFEVGQKKGVNFPQNVKKLRPLLIGLCIFTACSVMPAYIAGNVLHNALLQSIANILIAVMLSAILVLLLLAGIRLILKLDSLRMPVNHTVDLCSSDGLMHKPDPHEDVITSFTYRVRWYLITIGTSILLIVLTLILYVVTDARFKEWPFLVFQFALRALEFSYTFPTLFVLVQRKKPAHASFKNSTVLSSL